MKAYMEIDGGSTWQGHAMFDERPNVGDYVAYGKGKEGGRARVVAIEHREQVDGFVFTVLAEKEREPYAPDWEKVL